MKGFLKIQRHIRNLHWMCIPMPLCHLWQCLRANHFVMKSKRDKRIPIMAMMYFLEPQLFLGKAFSKLITSQNGPFCRRYFQMNFFVWKLFHFDVHLSTLCSQRSCEWHALVQIMAWHRKATSHYLKQWWPNLRLPNMRHSATMEKLSVSKPSDVSKYQLVHEHVFWTFIALWLPRDKICHDL